MGGSRKKTLSLALGTGSSKSRELNPVVSDKGKVLQSLSNSGALVISRWERKKSCFERCCGAKHRWRKPGPKNQKSLSGCDRWE